MFRRKIISIALVLAIILSIVVPGCSKKPTEIEPVSIENLSEFDGEPGHFYLQEASVDISFKIEYSGRFSATDVFSMTSEQDEKVDFRVKRDGDKQAILESPKDGYEKGATYILTLGERAHFTDESLKDARTLTFRIVRDKIEKYEYKESVIETDTISEIDEQTIDVKNLDVQVGDVITGENQNHGIVAYKIEKIADDGTAQISTPALEEIYSDLQFTGEYDWNVDEIIGNPDIKVQIADNFRKSGLYDGLVRVAYPKIDPAQKKNDLEIEVDLKKGSSENSIKAEVSVTIKPSEEELSSIVKQVAGPSLKITFIQEISLKSKVNFTGILHGDVSVAAKSTSSWEIAVIVSEEWKAQINKEEDDQSKAPQLVKSIVTKLNEMPKSVHKEELELFSWKIMVPSLPGLTFDAKFFFYLDCDLSAEASIGQTTNTYCIAGLTINNTQIKPYKKTTETNKDFTISIIGHINVKTGIGLSASAALFGDVLKVTAKLKFGIYFDMFSVSQVRSFEDISGLLNDRLYLEPGISFKIEIEAKAKLLFVEIKFTKELVKKDIPIKELTLGHKKIPLSLIILDDSVMLNEGMVIPPFIEFEYYDVKKGLVLAETLNTDQLTYYMLDGETEKKLKVSQDSIIIPEEYSDQELTIIARYDEDDAGLETQFTVMPESTSTQDKILFVSEVKEDGSEMISTMNLDGSDYKTLAEGTDPVFSPDGSKIAYESHGNDKSQIYIMDADGSNNTFLAFGYSPAFSPDGKTIVFESIIQKSETNTTIGCISTIGTDGKGLMNLCEGSYVANPQFSADGQQIIFCSIDYPDIGVYSMNLNGTNINLIFDGSNGDFGFSRTFGRPEIMIEYVHAAVGGYYCSSYFTDITGSSTKFIMEGLSPSMSYDGSKIVCTKYTNIYDEAGQLSDVVSDLWIMNSDGSDQKQILDLKAESYKAVFSPDGSTLLIEVLESHQEPLMIYIMNVDGSNLTQLAEGKCSSFSTGSVFEPTQDEDDDNQNDEDEPSVSEEDMYGYDEEETEAEVGDTVIFGAYEQDNNPSNGKEDIEWLVLAKEDNKILVISDKALDCRQYDPSYEDMITREEYDPSYGDITWEECTLRNWMNDTFLNAAFSADEQAKIHSTNVSADENPDYSTPQGNATTDKVFLLSITEANKYFSSDEARKCVPTAYAKAQNALTYDSHTKGGEATCVWWLRSLGEEPNNANFDYDNFGGTIYPFAAVAMTNGEIYSRGLYFYNDGVCVRPALWINLDS